MKNIFKSPKRFPAFPRKVALIPVVAMALCLPAFADEPAIEWSGSTGNYAGEGAFMFGFRFRAEDNLAVTALGVYSFGLDLFTPGLLGDHQVGIWLVEGGAPLATAIVPAGTAAPLEGHFRYVEIPEVVLAKGSEYVIASSNFIDGNEDETYAGYVEGITVSPHITWLAGRNEPTPHGEFVFPTKDFSEPQYGIELTPFGANLKFETTTTTIADRFDYPIGNRGLQPDGTPITGGVPENITIDPGDLDGDSETNELYSFEPGDDNPQGTPNQTRDGTQGGPWYLSQDTGSYYSGGEGIHPGEDWNFGNENQSDVGEPVYAVANGVVMDISSVNHSLSAAGYAMVIRHTRPRGDTIDSVYVHIAPDKKDAAGTSNTGTGNGVLVSDDFFSFQEGDPVQRGDMIGVIADIFPAHLHFEMRNKPISPLPLAGGSAASSGIYWPNDTDFVYYGAVANTGSMTLAEVESAYSDMRLDGIIDPSDFIDVNRTPPPTGSVVTNSVVINRALRQSIRKKVSKLRKKIKKAKRGRNRAKAKRLAKKMKRLQRRLRLV